MHNVPPKMPLPDTSLGYDSTKLICDLTMFLVSFNFFRLVVNKEETHQQDRPLCFKEKRKKSQTVALFLEPERNHQSMSYIIQPCRVCMTTQPTNRAAFQKPDGHYSRTQLFQTTRAKGASSKLVRRAKWIGNALQINRPIQKHY